MKFELRLSLGTIISLALAGCSSAPENEKYRSDPDIGAISEAQKPPTRLPTGSVCQVEGNPQIGTMTDDNNCCWWTNTVLTCYDCAQATCVPATVSRTALSLTNPGNQSSRLNATVGLSIGASGGTAPVAWSAVGLPPGLVIDTSGVVRGAA